MKKILSIWAILMLGLLIFGGVVIAQEEEEEATETKTIETQVMTQPQAGCKLMMQPMGGMMGSMGQGQMGCGMMPGMMGCMGRGQMGCGTMGCMGGGMGCGMGCGGCCEQLKGLGCPNCFMEMAAELKLTEKQVMELKTLCSAHKKDVIRKKADLKVAEMELGDLVIMPDPDMAKVRAKITAIGEMKTDMCLAQLATIEKAHRVLTSEQMTKLREIRKEMCCPTGKAGAGQTMKKFIKMKVIK